MSNGGYKGASPARETSPEQYPGVWELTEQFQAQADGNWPFQAADCAPKSLRFDGSSAHLQKTFATSGNRTAWTWSCWLKRGKMNSGRQVVFGSYNAANDDTWLEFGLDNTNAYYTTNNIAGSSNAALRDPAAFYHYFANFDGSTFKIFINNVEVLSSTSLAGTRGISGPYRHRIGQSPASHAGNIRYFDGVIAECNFIDGQVLSPSDFAFYDGQGIWQPKRFTGDYSNGPFYSNRTSVTGTTGSTDSTNAFDGSLTTYTSIGSGDATCTGTLTFTPSSPIAVSTGVRVYMQIDRGQSISVNGSQTNASVSAGWNDTGFTGTLTSLAIGPTNSGSTSNISAIEIDGKILKDASVGRNSFRLDFSDGAKDQSGLGNDWTTNSIGLAEFDAIGNTTHVGPGTLTQLAPHVYYNLFTVESNQVTSNPGSAALARFNFSALGLTAPATITFNSYEQGGGGWGTVSSNIYTDAGTVTSTSTSNGNTRYNTVNIPAGATYFEIPGSYNSAYQLYYNGIHNLVWNGVSYQHVSAADVDTFVDSPVNGNEASTGAGGERRGNYCNWNPLNATGATLANGNLEATLTAAGAGKESVRGTIAVSSGKYYWEELLSDTGNQSGHYGVVAASTGSNIRLDATSGTNAVLYAAYNGNKAINGTSTSYGASFTTNDVIGVALDLDGGTITFYKNGSSQGSITLPATGIAYTPTFAWSGGSSAGTTKTNFGQRSFSQTPPAGYSPIATCFLPEPSELAKNPSKAFDILLWSGDGANSNTTITGIDMESGPDMVWSKTRNHGYHNNIFDSVRGFGNSGGAPLTTDYTSSQATGGVIKSTDSTSITWEKASNNGYVWYGESGKNYVSWLWDAGTATTSIAVGGSNSLAYDQSQTWSGLWTGSTGYGSFTNLHDADDTDYAQSLNATLTFPSSIALTSLQIRHSSNFGTATLSVNGTDVTSQLATSGTKPLTTIKGFTTLTSISMSGADYQSNVHTLYEIFVNGRKLVDNGVTVASVPGAACDVRANPEAGFSIVKVDSPNSTEARIHGLSKAPDFIIAKATASGNTQHYHMFHSYFGKSHYATFTGDAWASSDQWGSQEPNSHSFYVKTNTGSGANFSGGMIYYIWHAVENYSAMGSFIGTGVSDGPMIHLGWEPKWLMIKSTDTSRHWRIYDATREPFNVKNLSLHASTANTETHFGSDEMDFLSNGFKIRSTGSFHNSQDKVYLYVAFAANPFALNTRAH